MAQPAEQKQLISQNQNQQNDQRCSYEKCELCPLFKYCETCYKEICLFENCNLYCKACAVTCHTYLDPEFESIDLGTLRVNRTSSINFSCLWFPTVRKNKILQKVSLEVVAVKFEEIYNFKSSLMRALDLYDFFEIKKSTKIIVTFNIPDRILEKIWLTFRKKTFRLTIKGLKASYICSPNFSNYFDAPRYQYWRNIWRNVVMANELSDLGHNVILDVSSPVSATHRFYKKLILRSNVKSLIFNCQTLKLDRYKKASVARLSFFNSLPKEIPFIVNGFLTKKFLGSIFRATAGRKLYFTSSSQFIRAVCKQQLSGRYANETPVRLFLKYCKETEEFVRKEKDESKKLS